MKTVQSKQRSIAPLGADELGIAERSGKIFARHTDKRGRLVFQIDGPKGKEDVIVPAAVASVFGYILAQAAEGNGISILPRQVELTTQQAADMLNVSRPFLIGLLDGGKIPSRKVGTHRRVYAKDVLDYKRADDARRSRALDKLVRQAQELNMGY
jgi:excisionase family DNA binding protein